MEHISLSNTAPPRNRDIDPQMDLTLVSTHQALYTYLTRSYRTWMLTGEFDPETEEMLTRSFQRFKDVNESDVRKQMEENDTLRQTLETARNEVVCFFLTHEAESVDWKIFPINVSKQNTSKIY